MGGWVLLTKKKRVVDLNVTLSSIKGQKNYGTGGVQTNSPPPPGVFERGGGEGRCFGYAHGPVSLFLLHVDKIWNE